MFEKVNLIIDNEDALVVWVVSPKICMVKFLPLAPQNMTVFGDGVFKETIKLKQGHRVVSNPI